MAMLYGRNIEFEIGGVDEMEIDSLLEEDIYGLAELADESSSVGDDAGHFYKCLSLYRLTHLGQRLKRQVDNSINETKAFGLPMAFANRLEDGAVISIPSNVSRQQPAGTILSPRAFTNNLLNPTFMTVGVGIGTSRQNTNLRQMC